MGLLFFEVTYFKTYYIFYMVMITYNLHHLNQEDLQQKKSMKKPRDHPFFLIQVVWLTLLIRQILKKRDFYRQITPPLVFYRKKQLDLSLSSLIIISKPYIEIWFCFIHTVFMVEFGETREFKRLFCFDLIPLLNISYTIYVLGIAEFHRTL